VSVLRGRRRCVVPRRPRAPAPGRRLHTPSALGRGAPSSPARPRRPAPDRPFHL